MTDTHCQVVQSLRSDVDREAENRDSENRDSERRQTERAWQSHEEAFERLLGRCRGLEDEKLEWVAGRRTLIDALAAAQRSADDRVAELERRVQAKQDRVRDLEAIDARHRDAAQAVARTQNAERDRMIEAHASALAEVETREENARHSLAQAEERFRIEAYQLSALLVLRSKETAAAAAEAVALRRRLELVLASTSWRVTRPIRVMSGLIRRASGLPRRAVRATWSRS